MTCMKSEVIFLSDIKPFQIDGFETQRCGLLSEIVRAGNVNAKAAAKVDPSTAFWTYIIFWEQTRAIGSGLVLLFVRTVTGKRISLPTKTA